MALSVPLYKNFSDDQIDGCKIIVFPKSNVSRETLLQDSAKRGAKRKLSVDVIVSRETSCGISNHNGAQWKRNDHTNVSRETFHASKSVRRSSSHLQYSGWNGNCKNRTDEHREGRPSVQEKILQDKNSVTTFFAIVAATVTCALGFWC